MFGAGVAYIVVFGLFLAGRTATAIGEGGPDGSDPSAVIRHRDVAVQPGAATGPLRRRGPRYPSHFGDGQLAAFSTGAVYQAAERPRDAPRTRVVAS